MGRRMLFPEHINLSLPEGKKDEIDALLQNGEDRLAMIRTAIDKELAARRRAYRRSPRPEAPAL